MGKYQELIFDKSDLFLNVTVVDLEPYLCEFNSCFVFIGENFLYADDDHLSEFGSHFVANKTQEIIFQE